MKRSFTALIIFFLLGTSLHFSLYAQDQTIGLFLHDSAAFAGYTLFAPNRSTLTYLIDNSGRKVHTWSSDYQPGQAAYLLENGHLLRTANPGPSKAFNAGGAGGMVQEYAWDGSLVWQFTYSSNNYCLHHDIEPLPNGNVLMIAWEYKSNEEALAAGRKSSLLSQGALWPDHIIEVKPDGVTGGTIVWEWHVWDHLIQDYDPTKANYGDVSQHPELIDVNYSAMGPQLQGGSDWNHTNSVAYHPGYDQVMLSVHNMSEVWVIDHSTTTAEAAGHSGGKYGKGGDLLYRWGNPLAYRAGSSSDRKLYTQHDAQWIQAGLPGAGNILIFNNGQRRPDGNYSTVDEIVPPVDSQGNYQNPASGESFAPASQAWSYQANDPADFYSQNISGAQRLANGNTLICEGASGTFFEVMDDFRVVWLYINPVVSAGPLTQGDLIPSGQEGQENSVFKIRRYAPDYLGLQGRDLTPGDPIEPGSDFVAEDPDYPIVDTGQTLCYSNTQSITTPAIGTAFFGQDAQHAGQQPAYRDNGDGTVSDLVTGLMWQNNPGVKLTYPEAVAGADTCSLGGYDDWRLPTIKELYSLIIFSGKDPSSLQGAGSSQLTPFIDTNYFLFQYGDESIGDRLIDAQYASCTKYVSTTMGGNETVFGVNFADGRIKGYPAGVLQDGSHKGYFVLYVRGNTGYGINELVDNRDGTISDKATGLMWQQGDSEKGMNWEEALAWVAQMNAQKYLGYSGWRLPNAKELQSLVDYSRSPATSQSAAIDPLFTCSAITDEGGKSNYPFYWTSTTHADMKGGTAAVYVAFGEALGWMEMPSNSGNYKLMDVHGAGAQRSDPKSGDPADFPHGFGPQGDVRRIYNYVRMVRDDESTVSEIEEHQARSGIPEQFQLAQNYPNPFNPVTTIEFSLAEPDFVELKVYDIRGREVEVLIEGKLAVGQHSCHWQPSHLPSGIYYYRLQTSRQCVTHRMVLLK